MLCENLNMIFQWWTALFILVILNYRTVSPIVISSTTSTPASTTSTPATLTKFEHNKFYLIAFVPVEIDKGFNKHGFVWSEILKFAFQEMMDSLKSEGFAFDIELHILDTRNEIDVTSSHIMDLLFQPITNHSSCCDTTAVGDVIIGFIGPASSSTVGHVFDILSFDQNYPIISYSATSVRFDNKARYPSFFRVIPPDDVQARLIVDLMVKYSWTYIGVVGQDDDYGRNGIGALNRLLSDHHICTGLEAIVDLETNKTVEEVRLVVQRMKDNKKANVFVLWFDAVQILKFLEICEEMELYGKTLILTESAGGEMATILNYDTRVTRGLISIVSSSGVYDSFEEEFRRTEYKSGNFWITRLFEEILNVSSTMIDQGVAVGEFWNKIPKAKTGFVYMSMRAYGKALKDYVMGNPQICIPQNTSPCLKAITENRSFFIEHYLKKTSFLDLDNKTISFDEYGNINSSQFRISTVQMKERSGQSYWKRVGKWDNVNGLLMLGDGNFLWSNGSPVRPSSNCSDVCLPGYERRNGSTACCWSCVPCQDNRVKLGFGTGKCEPCPAYTHTNKDHSKCIVLRKVNFDFVSDFGIAFIVVTSFNVSAILVVVIVFTSFKKTPVVMSSQFTLSMVQLFFLDLLNILVLMSLFKQQSENCIAFGILLPFIITMAILPTIFKTQRLNRIFKAKGILTRKNFHWEDIRITVLLLCLQTSFLCFYNTLNKLDKVVQIIDYETKEISINCDFDTFVYLQLAYLFVILFICGLSAFKARELPQNYNETRVIAYSMFTNCVILIFVVPLYASSTSEYKNRIVLFGLLLIDANIIIFVYSHKVWIILFRSNLNTVENFASSRMEYVNEDVMSFYKRKMCHRSSDVNSIESSPNYCKKNNTFMDITKQRN